MNASQRLHRISLLELLYSSQSLCNVTTSSSTFLKNIAAGWHLITTPGEDAYLTLRHTGVKRFFNDLYMVAIAFRRAAKRQKSIGRFVIRCLLNYHASFAMKPSQQTSILVVRLSAIGDIVMSSPVAAAIKMKWPHSQLTWIVHPECEPLLRGNPYIDELIVWDKKHWKQLFRKRKFLVLWKELRQLRKTLRARRFDLAIDLQGLMKSGVLAWLSGAKHRVGLGCQEGSTMLMTKSISRNLGDLDQIGSEYRYLVNQLGMPDSPWEMMIPVSDEAVQAAAELLQKHTNNQPFAVFCPFTTRPQKHWPDDYWRQLGLRLPDRYSVKLLILGGPADRDKAQEIAEGCGAVNLAGQTSLQEAAAIIRCASLLVGVDTGLTHMGHAFGVPTLALFGSTCPYTYTGLDTSKVLYLDLPCSPCRRNPTCGGTFDCMREITPDVVLSEIKSLID